MAGDKHKAKSFERHTMKDKVKVEITSEIQATNQISELMKETTRTQKTKKVANREAAKESRNRRDPIVASYDVFVKPGPENGKKLFVFQFPNRDAQHPYSAAYNNTPLEVRIKKSSALVEVDVPINTTQDYDREKGAKWGNAIWKNNPHGRGGSMNVGLAAGFGVGSAQPPKPRGIRRDQEEVTEEDLLRDWETSVAEEKVLMRQTLGGQILPKDSTKPSYLLGTFRQNQLHLTPVEGIIQMRPQFHHIDAQHEAERSGRPREQGLPKATEARAIHMSIKSTADGEEETTETIADRLRSVQEEPWKCYKYNDEESFEAWDAYSQQLFVQNTEQACKLASSNNKRQFVDMITAPEILPKIQEVRVLKMEERKEAVSEAKIKKLRIKKKREAAAEEEAIKLQQQELIMDRRRKRWMGPFLDGANDGEFKQ